MADPVSALASVGAVSSFLQILDFSGKVLYHAARLTASDDALRENIEIEVLTLQYEEMSRNVVESKVWNKHSRSEASPLIEAAKEINYKAGELLALLKDLRVTEQKKGLKRAYQSTRQAARAISKRAKIERKQNELQSLTGMLSITMHKHIADMQSDLYVDIQDQIRKVVDKTLQGVSSASQVMKEKEEREQRVLQSLVFEEIDYRHDTIGEAHENTFTWAVKEPNSKLKSWLAEGSGLFWICGLPGSGKSTFMKFLLYHPETKALLSSWTSQGQRWMIAAFFFWYLGSPIQRSIRGLLQSILYKIFCECPELMYIACPGRVKMKGHLHRPWSEKELFDTARAIAQTDCRSCFEGGFGIEEFDVRLVFFIDGLDEFDGNHVELVSVLQELSGTRRIKICASCRPWNVFVNAMGSSPFVIHLEELTHGDIECYVRDNLTKAEESQRQRLCQFTKRAPQAERLIKAVVDKANGVFFWVFLVVRSLVSGFEEGDSIEILQKRLELLPGELIPYFRVILDRTDKVYQQMTATALLLVGLPHGRKRNVLKYISFLDLWPMVDDAHYFENPNFAYDRTMTVLTIDQMHQMLIDASRLIRSTCRDFLHIPQCSSLSKKNYSSFSLVQTSQVSFIHRTVYDFLNLKDVRCVLQELTPSHLEEASVSSKVALARAKFIPESGPHGACTYINHLASCICSDPEPELRALQQLDDLEVQYIDRHCSSGCPIHEQTPSTQVLMKHQRMCAMRLYNVVLRTFTKRLAHLKASQNRAYGLRDFMNEVEVIRQAFGQGYTVTSGRGNGAAIDLGLLDVDLISSILAKDLAPDTILAAMGRGCEVNDLYSSSLARFLRNWLLSTPDTLRDDAVWSVVKLLIENGATIPAICQIPSAKHRRAVEDTEHAEFCALAAGDSQWKLWNMETASTEQALKYVVPNARCHEIDEMLKAGSRHSPPLDSNEKDCG